MKIYKSISSLELSKFLHKDMMTTLVSSLSIKPWGMEHPLALLLVLRKENNSYEAYSGGQPDEGAPERQELNSNVTCWYNRRYWLTLSPLIAFNPFNSNMPQFIIEIVKDFSALSHTFKRNSSPGLGYLLPGRESSPPTAFIYSLSWIIPLTSQCGYWHLWYMTLGSLETTE
jgi:hypothetical protein